VCLFIISIVYYQHFMEFKISMGWKMHDYAFLIGCYVRRDGFALLTIDRGGVYAHMLTELLMKVRQWHSLFPNHRQILNQ